MLAIVKGRPETLNLRGILKNYLDFQYENNTRKYRVCWRRAGEEEIQEGLIRACDVIDLIIAVLRGSRNLKDAKACLINGDTSAIRFKTPELEKDAGKLRFTEKQASAIWKCVFTSSLALKSWLLKKNTERRSEKSRSTRRFCLTRGPWTR